MPTFASGYIEPGTVVQVELQPAPSPVTPPFITALIGRTSSDKPVTKKLLRNAVRDTQFEVDQLSGAVANGITTVGANAVVEARNMDTLEFTAQTDITSVDAIVDDLGVSHLKGVENSWIPTFYDGTVPVAGEPAWTIEWVEKYRTDQFNAPQPIVTSVVGSTAPVQLSRVFQDPLFGLTSALWPTGNPGQMINCLNGQYVLKVSREFSTPTNPGLVTFSLHDLDNVGALVTATHNIVGSIAINTSASPQTSALVPFLSAGAIPASPTTNVRVLTALTPTFSTHSYNFASTLGIVEFDLTTESGQLLKFRVDLNALNAAMEAVPTTDVTNSITVTAAGPAVGTAGSVSVPGDGTKYNVLYRRIKSSTDFEPRRFDDTRSLQDFHGAVTATTTTDALSFGAVPYFREGGGSVYAVPLLDKTITGILTDPDLTTDAGYVYAVELALTALEDVKEVSCVIPLSPTEGGFRTEILNLTKAHVLNMSAVTESKPRMALMGARANTVNTSVYATAQALASSNRVVYMTPATAPISAGGFAFTGDGSTLAAAVAGILSQPSLDAGEPITGKELTAFNDVPDPFTRTQKNTLAAEGLTVIEKQDGGAPTIRHFLTTDPTSVLTVEAKVTRIEIDVRRTLKDALDKTLINTRLINGQTIGTARSIIGLILSQKVNANIINEFQITKVAKNAVDPRQLDVELAIRPTFDLNYIFVRATFVAA